MIYVHEIASPIQKDKQIRRNSSERDTNSVSSHYKQSTAT